MVRCGAVMVSISLDMRAFCAFQVCTSSLKGRKDLSPFRDVARPLARRKVVVKVYVGLATKIA